MDKKQLIKKIEGLRNSKVITYLTSDRPGPVNARIAGDIIPIISNQLRQIGKVENIDLFLYSTGGDTLVPWRLVSMIREYCNKFSVLIPYKANSAATMISLGAYEIVMTDLSELSPIDPSTANVFNTQDPQNLQNKIPISVEDVMAYFDLAKNKFGIKSDKDLTTAMSELHEEYKKEMGLGMNIWNPEMELGSNFQIKKDYKIACIESEKLENYFELSLEFKKGQVNITQQTPQGPIQVPQDQVMWKVVGQGWR